MKVKNIVLLFPDTMRPWILAPSDTCQSRSRGLIPIHFCVGKGRIHTWETILGNKVLGSHRSLDPFSLSGKLEKIGIFLDISAKQLPFYNVRKKPALYNFTIYHYTLQNKLKALRHKPFIIF